MRKARRSATGRSAPKAHHGDHVVCSPTKHPVGGVDLGQHLWHAEAVAPAAGGTCGTATVAYGPTTTRRGRGRRSAPDPLTVLAMALPAACLLDGMDAPSAPCGANPKAAVVEVPYARAQLPPPSIAVDWLGITPGATLSSTSTVTSVILWP